MPKLGGAATIAVTSDAETTVSGKNSRSILCIDPPRRTPQQNDEQSVDDEERCSEGNLPSNGGATQRRGSAVEQPANRFHRRQRALGDVQRRQSRGVAECQGDHYDAGGAAEN